MVSAPGSLGPVRESLTLRRHRGLRVSNNPTRANTEPAERITTGTAPPAPTRPLAAPNALPCVLRARGRAARPTGCFDTQSASPNVSIRRCDGAARQGRGEICQPGDSRRAQPPRGHRPEDTRDAVRLGRPTDDSWLRLVAPRAQLSADSRRGRDRAPRGAARASSPPAVRAPVDPRAGPIPVPTTFPARPLVSPSLKPRLPIPPPLSDEERL